MPPELLMDGKLTKAGDVYAFGEPWLLQIKGWQRQRLSSQFSSYSGSAWWTSSLRVLRMLCFQWLCSTSALRSGCLGLAGVLLWGMYTGLPPWQGMRRTQVMFKVTALGAKLQIPSNAPPFFKVQFLANQPSQSSAHASRQNLLHMLPARRCLPMLSLLILAMPAPTILTCHQWCAWASAEDGSMCAHWAHHPCARLMSEANVGRAQSLLDRCMARDHKARPTFKELVEELSVLSELALAGLPLDSPALAEATPVLAAAASFRKNKSLSSSTMQQVYPVASYCWVSIHACCRRVLREDSSRAYIVHIDVSPLPLH
jgi:serine/threonine protein kinase